jgi:parvulin-like peptidyl-prolyl isomerase
MKTAIVIKNMQKQSMSLVLLGIVCLVVSCSRDDLSDREYIATVNDEKIYYDEYQKRLNTRQSILPQGVLPDSLSKQRMLEEEILESMITEKIILQRANQLNLTVSEAELEQKVLDIRKDYGDHFFDFLIAQNVQYNEWCAEIQKEMLMDKVVAADVNASILVSEDEAKDYFHKNPDRCKSEERVRVSQIVVRNPEKASAIKARLESSEDFAGVAVQESIGPEASRGGDLGLITKKTMPEPLDDTIFHLPEGIISPIVKSIYGYHILKVNEKYPARTRTFEECKEDIVAEIRIHKEDAAFTEWLEKLRRKAVIKKDTKIFKEKLQNK